MIVLVFSAGIQSQYDKAGTALLLIMAGSDHLFEVLLSVSFNKQCILTRPTRRIFLYRKFLSAGRSWSHTGNTMGLDNIQVQCLTCPLLCNVQMNAIS